MIEPLVGLGLLVAAFVAYNIGGATTGPAFGPAVGADVISKTTAAALMTVCFFAGAITLGRRVVDTLGDDLLTQQGVLTLEASIIILFFIGGALLVGNLTGVPSSTSMTAVGAIAGFAVSAGVLNVAVVGEILAWWIIGPVFAFWISVMIGRTAYDRIDEMLAIDRSEGSLLVIDRWHGVPVLVPEENTNQRELYGAIATVAIGCLMAFSSGTSNIANAIAPLVGAGELGMNVGIVFGSAAVAIGAFTIARRTMETLGNDITDLPLTAALIVAVISSGTVIALSAIGIPAQFVIIATLSIVGLGWGRATEKMSMERAIEIEGTHGTIGEYELDATASGGQELEIRDLFDPTTTARVVVMQTIVPGIATVATYGTFEMLSVVPVTM